MSPTPFGWNQIFPGGELINLYTGELILPTPNPDPEPDPDEPENPVPVTRVATLTLQPDRTSYIGNWTTLTGAVTTALLINGTRVRERVDPEGTNQREFPFLSTAGTYRLVVTAGAVTIQSPVYNWAPDDPTNPTNPTTPVAALALINPTTFRGTWSPLAGQITSALLINGTRVRELLSPAGTVTRDFTSLSTTGSYKLVVSNGSTTIESATVQWDAPVVVNPDPDPDPTDPDPDPNPEPDPGPSQWPNGPTIMLSATDGTANKNTLQDATAANDSFTWDAPGTGIVPLNGVVTVAGRCRRIRAANPNRLLQQRTGDSSVFVKYGRADTLRAMGNIAAGSRTVPGNMAGISVGDHLYLQSDNPIKANGKQSIGLLVVVTAVGSNSCTVDLAAPSLMSINCKFAKINMASSLEIDGGVYCHVSPSTQVFRDMIGFYAVKSPTVTSRTRVERGGPGIGLYLTTDAYIAATIRWLVDDQDGDGYHDETGARRPNLAPGTNNFAKRVYGYSVPIYGANRRVKIRGHHSYCRHAGTTNAASGKQVGLITDENGDTKPWQNEAGDTPEVDYSVTVTRTTSTPVSSHEALGLFWVHDCDIFDGGLYWATENGTQWDGRSEEQGKENTDFMNMRSNSLIENCRFWLREIESPKNYGLVLQNLLSTSLPDPLMRVRNCIVYKAGSCIRNKGGRIDISNTTLYVRQGGVGIFHESGITTGNNVVIVGLGSGASGIQNQGSGTVNLTNVRFVNIGTKATGSGINFTEGNATGSSLTLPFTP